MVSLAKDILITFLVSFSLSVPPVSCPAPVWCMDSDLLQVDTSWQHPALYLLGMLLSCLPLQGFPVDLAGWKATEPPSTYTSAISKWTFELWGWELENTFYPFLSPEGLSWEAVIYTAKGHLWISNNQLWFTQDSGQLNNAFSTSFPPPFLLSCSLPLHTSK